MEIMSLVKSAKFAVFAVVLAAFLALAFAAGPASAAGVGVMKRSGERDSSSTSRAEKATAERGRSAERSGSSRESGSADTVRRSSMSRQESSAPNVKSGRPDSSNRPSSVFTQNRSSEQNRNDSRPQRENARRPDSVSSQRSGSDNRVDRAPNVSSSRPDTRVDRTPSVSSSRPDERADRTSSVVSGRPAQESRTDNRPQRQRVEDSRDTRDSRSTPQVSNSSPDDRRSTPEARTQGRSGIGTIMGGGRRETSEQAETARPQIISPTPSTGTHHTRVESASPGRTGNRPQRVESNTQDYRSDAGRVRRSPDRAITRVYEQRRDWRNHYRDYDHKWRPSHRHGHYYYKSRLGLDPWYYGYYSFVYVPRYTYPSIYFHYGAFPYIYSDRVVILARPARHYNFVTLDLGRLYYDDYYLDRDYIPYNGYVLSSSARHSLRAALDDIRYAWEEADNDRLLRHAVRSKRIDVFDEGSYSYSIGYDDYRDMTRDAMATIDTADFEFTRVRMRSPNEVVAYGRHNYYNAGDDYPTIYVSYTLERMSARWYITEVGASRYGLDD